MNDALGTRQASGDLRMAAFTANHETSLTVPPCERRTGDAHGVPHCRQFFHPVCGELQTVLSGGSTRHCPAAVAHFWRHKLGQRVTQFFTGPASRAEGTSYAQFHNSSCVVGLIPREWQNKLWASCLQCRGGRPDSAVVNDGGAEREQLAKRREEAVTYLRRQVDRDLVGVFRHEYASRTKRRAGLHCCAEETGRMSHPGAEGEYKRRRSVFTELPHILGEVSPHAVKPAEAGEANLSWPVRLGRCIPAGE